MMSSAGHFATTSFVAPPDSLEPSAPSNQGLESNQTLSPEPDFDALSKRFDSLRKRQL